MQKSELNKALICGYAAIYSSQSTPIKNFVEVFMPGAFDEALRNQTDCQINLNHEQKRHLGKVSSGQLKLEADSTGLWFELRPTDQFGRDYFESIRRGDYTECSVSFTVEKNGAELQRTNEKDIFLRKIYAVKKLHDISVVANPAYPGTSIFWVNDRSDLELLKRCRVKGQLTALQASTKDFFTK